MRFAVVAFVVVAFVAGGHCEGVPAAVLTQVANLETQVASLMQAVDVQNTKAKVAEAKLDAIDKATNEAQQLADAKQVMLEAAIDQANGEHVAELIALAQSVRERLGLPPPLPPNSRECVVQHNSDTNDGVYMSCEFTKAGSYDESLLRVSFFGGLRIIASNGGNVCRWSIRINNQACTEPHGAIDAALHENAGGDDTHRPSEVLGLCDKTSAQLGAGTYSVTLYVAQEGATANCYTGWEGSSRLVIEEIPRSSLNVATVVG
eukprot:m.478039 g.478039  ORF g.478039 m.478039 type:complete len:262 (+) comp21015_c0_seq1:109-894(+)